MIDYPKTIAPDKLKDILIEKVALQLSLPENTVEEIISHQFYSIKEALRIKSQVEIADFGKFLISPGKLKRRVQQLEKMKIDIQNHYDSRAKEERKPIIQKRLESVQEKIDKLKTKR